MQDQRGGRMQDQGEGEAGLEREGCGTGRWRSPRHLHSPRYLTMFLCLSSLSRQISRSAELGTPCRERGVMGGNRIRYRLRVPVPDPLTSSSSSSRTRFSATISCVSRFLALNTVP